MHQSIIIITTIVFLGSRSISSESITLLELNSKAAEDDKAVFTLPSFVNPSIAYAKCDNALENRQDKNCVIHHQSNVFENSTKNKCPVASRANFQSCIDDHELLLVPFGTDRVIVAWLEESQNITLLRMRNIEFPGCATTEVNFKVDEEHGQDFVKIVDFKDWYDVVFRNKQKCGSRYCKVTLSKEGKILKDPKEWIDVPISAMKLTIRPIKKGTLAGGYLVIEHRSGDVAHVQLIDSNDKLKLERSYSDIADFDNIAHSSAHDAIRICVHHKRSIKCDQFDKSGDLKIQTQHSFNYDVKRMVIYNLPNNGFLLLTTECSYRACLGKATYHVTKIDVSGRESGIAQRGGCQLIGYDLEDRFVERKEGEYCLILRCAETNLFSLVRFRLDRTCFIDDDFSVKLT